MGEFVNGSETTEIVENPVDSVKFSLWDNNDHVKIPDLDTIHTASNHIPPYFWGVPSPLNGHTPAPTKAVGFREAGDILGDCSPKQFDKLVCEATEYIEKISKALGEPENNASKHLASLRLSDDLQKWRQEQYAQGKVLPSKGFGLTPVAPEILKMLGAETWPGPLIAHATLWGCGLMELLIGGYDARTMMSNLVNDTAFYYEHAYHKVFPGFDALIDGSVTDQYALNTPGGVERRLAVDSGLRYIKAKVAMEEKYKAKIGNRSAVMDRRTMQVVSLCESSLLGMAAEALARGYDPGVVMTGMVFSCPTTDVVDVGRDLHNSEIMNSLLNTADFTDDGIVTEEKLRRVFDAYAHGCARIFLDHWEEPTSRMTGQLYKWHTLNDRHRFYRLAVLGYPKARKVAAADQREADFDEVFDERFHTTGFSRPLASACDGGDPCDAVRKLADKSGDNAGLIHDVWWHLVTGPMEYVVGGEIKPEREDELTEKLAWILAYAFSQGLVVELAWLCSHASHHAWQINFMLEAAMFGSFLDDGSLIGRLDRVE
ncbi:hypothetical protein QBC47DRAFT_396681 [Echria macrotheca]|uniref:Uncharacterized protein n=1 Tax=Echria macrotheca TaxID=438768 RepID=A0AAJ0FG75_9PEZI|nr:hypothetical protein QBC47DRAFT_396681 [Echria macrotheca]